MKVRMLTGMAGRDADGREFAVAPGEEITLDAETAKRLLESDQAEPVAAKASDRAERRQSKAAAAAETR